MSSSVFSRWWNLPGHLQRLFTHGLKQPWEAQAPQCRPQVLTGCCFLLNLLYNATFHTQATHTCTNTYREHARLQLKHTHTHTHTHKHTFPGYLPHVQFPSSAGVDFRWMNAPNSEFFVQTRQSGTIVSKWEHWNSFMRPAWGVFMSSRG